ncbi:MAG TPA: hypothetical protein VMS14_00235 [Ilumatobacteraceae bacterium]|nr:hypothetical protein [Ilumatobacteraceae bacterium]
MGRRVVGLVVCAAVAVAACSGGDDDDGAADTTSAVTTATTPETDAPTTTAPAELSADVQARLDELNGGAERPECDYLADGMAAASGCYLPFPSDWFTVTDESTATGKRMALPSTLSNVDGLEVDLTEWNRNDGYSPNTPILLYVPGIDAEASALPTWTDIGASITDTSPVMLVDISSGERIPLWAELDSNADDDADRMLTVRPAISLPEGHSFAVGFRGLVDTSGAAMPVDPDFALYQLGVETTSEWFESRRAEMDATFTALNAGFGVSATELQYAWSFTVASTDNIAGRMLHIRDDALAALGDAAPAFTITSVTPFSDEDIAVQVQGTFTVPNYLTGDGGPGNRFNYASDAVDSLPEQNGTIEAPFMCNISVATMSGTEPAHLVIYGHGLLGSHDEINAGNVRAMSNEHNVVHCATKWAGMSEDDVGNAVATLQNMANFPTMADRLQQGVLNQIFLGRLMTRPGGLVDDGNFKRADGSSLIDTAHLDYDGNSQGGIMGLMLAAVSPDIERVVLGVPGMNYSMLLPRSVDFDDYEAIFEPAYPNDADRVVIIALTQMLWDRGEGAGYVQHVTSNPYPNTPAKTVLMHVAFGDHQVTELSALVEARTMGLTIQRPVAAEGRWQEVEPGWGLESTEYPSDGSAIVVWDSGMAPIPFENHPPREGDDSHEDPRRDPDVRDQKASFLFDDTLVDVCGGEACPADHSP